jgi:uncharacterized membrane protein YedE/YeeE
MEQAGFTPGAALAGGALIGLASSLLWWSLGRVAGVSGIVGGLLRPVRGDVAWRAAFVAGLVAAGGLAAWAAPALLAAPTLLASSSSTASSSSEALRAPGWMLLAGVIAGFGARLGGGCTAGHGICGLSRLSPRSLVATLTFMATAIATATVMRLGGTP